MTSGADDADAIDRTTDLVNQEANYAYADEILPFDITITFANEYGQRSIIKIYGVELLNEGSGFSIDTVAAEKAYTFIARRVEYMVKDTDEGTLLNSHKLRGAENE